MQRQSEDIRAATTTASSAIASVAASAPRPQTTHSTEQDMAMAMVGGFEQDAPNEGIPAAWAIVEGSLRPFLHRNMNVYAPFAPGSVLNIRCPSGPSSSWYLVAAFRQRVVQVSMEGPLGRSTRRSRSRQTCDPATNDLCALQPPSRTSWRSTSRSRPWRGLLEEQHGRDHGQDSVNS